MVLPKSVQFPRPKVLHSSGSNELIESDMQETLEFRSATWRQGETSKTLFETNRKQADFWNDFSQVDSMQGNKIKKLKTDELFFFDANKVIYHRKVKSHRPRSLGRLSPWGD